MTWQPSSFHRSVYAAWGGNPNGDPCRPDRCAETVCANERGAIPRQCQKKRGYGPEQAFCKTHDPEAIERRRKEADARWQEQREREKRNSMLYYGEPLIAALRQIAAGHNDPRSLAAEVLDAHRISREPPK